MYRASSLLFRSICRLTLFLFLFQTLQPTTLGFRPDRGSAHDTPLILGLLSLGVTAAHAQASDPLLASTPDANTSDPYIVEKAAALGHDPARIFQFVRDEIGYESYQGSLRGARGTLWSKAGNALDQASLLIALLRTSGIPARYVQGTLSDDLSKQLILSMFPPPLRVVGCPPEDAVRADPANDPQLLTETREHYWVEFDAGSGFQAADPTFKDAQIGQGLGTAQGTFAEVPDTLRHKVTVRLKAEFPAGIAGTAGFGTEIPLNETFNTVELVGKPLSIGHFVNAFSPPALFFGYTTYTYSPYILIGQNDSNIADDEIIHGTDYQEFLTNFPLASQFLTGLFLEIDVKSPDGKVETFERTLLDRIGFATRQNGGSISLSGSADQGPALSDMDLVTINVLPGLQSLDAIANQKDRVESLQTQLSEIKPLIDAIPTGGPQTAEQRAVLSEALNLTRETLVSNGEILTMAFAGASDVALGQLQQGYLTKGYYISPRLLVTLTKQEANNLSVKIDLRKNDLRAVPAPGQVSGIGFAFEMARGLMESTLEGNLFSQVTGMQAISVADIFGNLGADTSLALITADNLQLLEDTALSATAKARISQAAEAGNAVLTPTSMVTIGNLTTVGWLEIDFRSGHTIGVMEDGGHQAIFEYPLIPSTPANIVSGAFIGFELGFSQGNIIFLGNFLAEVSAGTPFVRAVKDSKLAVVKNMLNQYFNKAKGVLGQQKVVQGQLRSLLRRILTCVSKLKPDDPEGLLKLSECIINAYQKEGFILPSEVDLPIFAYTLVGMGTALAWIDRNAPVDPPVFAFLSSDLGPGPALVPSGTVPSVAAQIVPDAYFTIPVNGAEVPSVFKAQIQNLGPAADTFTLAFSGMPAGFKIQSSVPTITVPPGATGEVGICVQPVDQIPSSGTAVPFSISVTSTTNQAVSTVANQTFTLPDIPAVTLIAGPAGLSSTPGTPASTTLTLKSVGNVSAGNVTLAINAPPGLTVSGLTSPVTLGAGESVSQSLTLTPAANVPLNSTLTATITATYGSASGQPQTASTQVSVTIRSAETVAVEQAALAAAQAANSQLATSLSTLADTLGQLQSTPTDARLWERLNLELSNLSLLLQNDPALVSFVSQLQQARDLAVAQNLSALLGLVPDLFSGIGGAFQHAFTLALSPASVALQPGQAQDFNVRLENRGTAATTVNLVLGPLPAGVTATLSQTQVTLAPGEVRDASSAAPITLTLSQSVQSVKTFPLRLSGTAAEAPALIQSTSAYVAIRPAIADVLSVSANPAVVEPGTPVAISAQLLNAANALRSVLASVEVRNQADAVVATLPNTPLTLMPGTNTIAVDLGSFSTDGLAKGLYELHVSLLGSDGGPLPGRAAQTPFFVGMPVSATVRAEPSLVAPGTAEVATIIEVTNQTVPVGGNPISSGTEINTAIQKGLAYLNNTQTPGGYWNYGGYEQAATGAAAFAMLSQKSQWGTNASQYQADVDNAISYLLGSATTATVGVRADGFNPCGTGTCMGVYWYGAGETTYTTGLVAPAIALYAASNPNAVATSSGPLAGLTWSQIAQGITNLFAASQTTAAAGNRRGGWRYYPGEQDSDMSTTQWAVISMIYDQTLGATTPQFVRDELKYWLAAVQYINTDLNDPNHVLNGVACYQPLTQPCDNADTGGLLLSLNFVGDTLSAPTVQSALGFLNNYWTQPANNTWYGNFGQPYAMWADYKALEVTVGLSDTSTITNLLDPTCGGDIPSANCNWWQDYNQWLVANQNADGSWTGYAYWGNPLSTAFSLPILGGTNIPTITLNLSVRHQLPPSGYVVEPGSVSPPADSLSPSEVVWATRTFDTRTATFQLNGQAPDLTPGESRQVSLGTEIIAEVITAGGERIEVPINLPPAVIAVTHMLGLAPPSQTVARGAEVLYNVQITNPTGTSETFTLSTVGLEEFSTTLAPSVSIPAGQTINTPLTVAVPAGVPEIAHTFSVQAQTAAGGLDTVEGQLIIQGGDAGGPPPPVSLASLAVSMDIVPVQPIAGQGTMATYRVIVTNVGNQTDSYNLSASLPASFTGVFSQNTVEVPPGLDNFREVLLTVTPPPGTPAQSFDFTVTAVSGTQASVSDQAHGTVTVVGNGVDVAISPATGTSDTTFQVTVHNIGTQEDSFDLSLGGALAPAATLGSTVLTLAPGAAQTVAVTLAPIDFADPGALELIAVATSRGNSAVQGRATARVDIPTRKGMTANFEPAVVDLPAPGPATTLLLVRNTGNTEDAYTATITGTTGAVTASLSGLDGQPTQTIPVFRLPGLTTGAILLRGGISTLGQGTVTVAVSSINDPSLTATATATLRAGAQVTNQPPIADAGPAQTVVLGQTVTLNGQGSHDPDNGPQALTFQWGFVSVPPQSALSDANLTGANAALASFRPDVSGDYLLRLRVSDGAAEATAQVLITVRNNPPVADAGRRQNAKTGTRVMLDGTGSYDPDGQLIHYTWSVESRPANSLLTDAQIEGSTLPRPVFVPDMDGTYRFKLVVHDGALDSAPAFVEVQATSLNVPPNARAGEDQTALPGKTVVLDGGASFDPDHAPGALTYLWTLAARPTNSRLSNLDILNADKPQAQFIPDVPGLFDLALQVSDGAATDTDHVQVTAMDPNVRPNAVAGSDQVIEIGGQASLDGSASFDPDQAPGAPLSFLWRFVSIPDGSGLSDANIQGALTATPNFTPDVVGDYVLRLAVSDGTDSAFDNVLVAARALSFQSLSPKTATISVNTQDCVTANITDQNNNSVAGVRVAFNVTGANPTAGFSNTDNDGNARFCYIGTNAGQDIITASVGTISDTASKIWKMFKCPLSQGFWKTHSAAWPVASLSLGSKTYSQAQLLAILNRAANGDASVILAYQLIAAKLNIARGSDPSPVAATIAHADALLAAYSGKVPLGVKSSSAAGQPMVADGTVLDSYNNGALTPTCSQ